MGRDPRLVPWLPSWNMWLVETAGTEAALSRLLRPKRLSHTADHNGWETRRRSANGWQQLLSSCGVGRHRTEEEVAGRLEGVWCWLDPYTVPPRNTVGPVHCVHPQVPGVDTVPSSGPVSQTSLSMWNTDPKRNCLDQRLGRAGGEGRCPVHFLSQIGEPIRSQLRKELTQGRPELLYYPEYSKQITVTVFKNKTEQGLGTDYDTKYVPGTYSSPSAASYLEKASCDCKNFILFNNNNNRTKIIQSTFNT